MADIVLGLWTSHGPTLSTTPEQWLARLPADHKNKRLFWRGTPYDFEGLTAERAGDGLDAVVTIEERTRRHAACQVMIDKLAEAWADAAPDAVVIFGNDQKELFLDSVIPALTIYNGESFYGEPPTPEQEARMPPGIAEAEWGCKPRTRTEYAAMPELANAVIAELMQSGFDPAVSSRLPDNPGHWSSGIPHAFGFIIERVMRDHVPPILPIISNTFFPPNQPSAARAFAMGQAVGRVLKSWGEGKRIAIVGSGGMSHFVIDEDFDRQFMDAFQRRDAEFLTGIDESMFQSGTSELKNWIAAAGVLFETDLSGDIVEYQGCYRSNAGTGTANGAILWS
ncbi:MAG: protocatechuate 3,4-dioxygenase [Erythrobacter sp.]|uniref:DODA-type extradiol aromatic ring-opening family dioxygenase n=1 Tax=Erythrobacter sp. TaxID=1042 RepID=UPI00260B890A|nr:protocatechuate 3,4-dioxygenase [Erythrobacter sp.]MDJ0978150.1 protocatechuate 3,4-dioxygenase [Erythrobacter sp.]